MTANAAIVPIGNGGEVSTFAYNDTDLIIDIDGYFAPPGAGALSLYPAAACRVLDTRSGNGAFSGTLSPPVDVLGSVCAPPKQSLAYVFNATVVPSGSLGYLTLWPDGSSQPVVSTLNAYDGAVLADRLKNKRYEVEVLQREDSAHQPWYLVRVGRYADRALARSVAAKLASEDDLGLKPFICVM